MIDIISRTLIVFISSAGIILFALGLYIVNNSSRKEFKKRPTNDYKEKEKLIMFSLLLHSEETKDILLTPDILEVSYVREAYMRDENVLTIVISLPFDILMTTSILANHFKKKYAELCTRYSTSIWLNSKTLKRLMEYTYEECNNSCLSSYIDRVNVIYLSHKYYAQDTFALYDTCYDFRHDIKVYKNKDNRINRLKEMYYR